MKRFLLPFLLILIISTAYAQDYCKETTYKDSVNIYNNYNTVAHYELTKAGKSAIFTTLDATEGFFLQPGESKTVNFETYMAFEGDYDLQILVQDSKGKTTNYNYHFNIINCHTISTELYKENHYCLNGGKEYTLMINNTGLYNETLNVNIGREHFNTTLSPSEARNYSLTFYPANSNDDLRTLSITNNHITYSKTVNFNVTNCDATTYDIEEAGICEGLTREHSFKLKNEGLHADNYTISTNSPLITILNNNTSLAPDEEEIIKFSISTECGNNGLKITSIKVNSALTGDFIVPVVYDVKNCYDQSITLLDEFTDYCEKDNKTVSVKLENKGTETNTYNIYMSFGPNNNTRVITLGPGESEDLTISYNNISKGVLNFGFEGTSTDHCGGTKSIIEDVNVQEYEDCYNGVLTVQENFYNNNTRVIIENNGTRDNTYLVRVFASVEVDNSSISLAPSESVTFYLKQLLLLHDEYGVDSFNVSMRGAGVFSQSNTTYYDNSITGMLVETAKNSSFILGLGMLIFLVYAFIRKK